MNKIQSDRRTNNTPVKWHKHLTLVEWQLRDMQHLTNSIHRYPIQRYTQCLSDIRKQLLTDNGKHTFVVILVYPHAYLNLPNIVISSIHDLENAVQTLNTADLTKYTEIWYCKNDTHNNDTAFGRISFGNDELFPRRCAIRYEIVWGTSARKIEQYPAIDDPFVAFDRENWNATPKLDVLITGNMQRDALLALSDKIIATISKYTVNIIDFATFVFSRGCKYLSLDFIYCNGEFSFIDWDSDDDMKVLQSKIYNEGKP